MRIKVSEKANRSYDAYLAVKHGDFRTVFDQKVKPIGKTNKPSLPLPFRDEIEKKRNHRYAIENSTDLISIDEILIKLKDKYDNQRFSKSAVSKLFCLLDSELYHSSSLNGNNVVDDDELDDPRVRASREFWELAGLKEEKDGVVLREPTKDEINRYLTNLRTTMSKLYDTLCHQ